MRRNWLIAAIVLGLLAIVLAAIAMRLSDEEPATTQDWADEVCASLSDWRTAIADVADTSGEPLTAESLRGRLEDAEDATFDLVSQLRDLGPPDLAAGDELEEQLDASAAELESSFDALRESADDALDAPAADLSGALTDLASDFAALRAAAGQVVGTLQNADVAESSRAELEQAFAAAPACASLRDES